MNNLKTRSDLGLLSIKKTFQIYILFLLVLMAARTFFVFYFGTSEILSKNVHEILYAFFMGWRYDSMAIVYMILPIYLLLFTMSLVKSYFLYNVTLFLSKVYGFILTLIIPAVLISDLAFYSYFQDHINIIFFGLFEDDTAALFKTMWENYPVLYILGGAFLYIVITGFILGKIFRPLNKRRSLLHGGFFQFSLPAIIAFILLAGAARGGYRALVLAPKYADFSQNEFINQIPVNGFIALEKSLKLRFAKNKSDYSVIKELGYEGKLDKAFSDFLGFPIAPTKQRSLMDLLKRTTPKNLEVEKKKVHVIVLLMESFGGSWSRYQSESFDFLGGLQKHFNEGIYFKNFVSSGNGTIASLVSLATNISPIPGKRYLSESKYMQIPLGTAGHIPYKNSGYETYFVYGGKLGWRDIGKYMRFQGYDEIVGENRIRESLKLNTKNKAGAEWGLFDEYFFEYIYNQVKNSTVPKMILGLSTSNHPPFDIPDDYKGRDLKLLPELKNKISREENLFMKRFKAFQYANDQLAKFISRVKQSDIAENTLIAVTGDHNFWGFLNYDKTETFLKYTVPFYLYVPERLGISSYDANKLGSHEDIFSTLYNISLSETEYLSFGEDLLSESKSYALNLDLQASEEGLLYKGTPYSWDQIPRVKGKTSKNEVNLAPLKKRYNSTMAISDFYLESLFKGQKK